MGDVHVSENQELADAGNTILLFVCTPKSQEKVENN